MITGEQFGQATSEFFMGCRDDDPECEDLSDDEIVEHLELTFHVQAAYIIATWKAGETASKPLRWTGEGRVARSVRVQEGGLRWTIGLTCPSCWTCSDGPTSR